MSINILSKFERIFYGLARSPCLIKPPQDFLLKEVHLSHLLDTSIPTREYFADSTRNVTVNNSLYCHISSNGREYVLKNNALIFV